MQIGLNKDFEREYPDQGIKGLTFTQSISALLGIGVTVGLGVWLWVNTNLPPEATVYLSLPIGAVIVLFGCFKFQGELSLVAFLMTMLWVNQTKCLLYDAGEYDRRNQRVYTMRRENNSTQKRMRRRRA